MEPNQQEEKDKKVNPTSAAAKSLALCFVFLLSACASTAPPAAVSHTALVGTWKVDLRPTPDAAPSFQNFVVSSATATSFQGTFYGTPVTQARVNTQWGAVRIAFVTADQSGPYNHSAVLVGGKLEGLTNSTGRDFLAYWSAVKSQPQP
jgi:hypothetical protein